MQVRVWCGGKEGMCCARQALEVKQRLATTTTTEGNGFGEAARYCERGHEDNSAV